MSKYRLRDLKLKRVDLVDAGANQESHIVFTKADDQQKPAPQSGGGAMPGGAPFTDDSREPRP